MERLWSSLPGGYEDLAHHHGARRRDVRWLIDAEVDFLAPVRGPAMAINASRGGIRIATELCLRPGDRCTFRVNTELGLRTLESAEVIWRRVLPDGYLLGLRFIEYTPSELN